MIPRLSRVVDKQQSADSEPGLARRFGFMSAVTFTLSMLALDVTETVAVVRKIDNDPLSVGVSILIPLAFVAMLAAIQTSTAASRRLWTRKVPTASDRYVTYTLRPHLDAAQHPTLHQQGANQPESIRQRTCQPATRLAAVPVQ
jgi:hypothetical protein